MWCLCCASQIPVSRLCICIFKPLFFRLITAFLIRYCRISLWLDMTALRLLHRSAAELTRMFVSDCQLIPAAQGWPALFALRAPLTLLKAHSWQICCRQMHMPGCPRFIRLSEGMQISHDTCDCNSCINRKYSSLFFLKYEVSQRCVQGHNKNAFFGFWVIVCLCTRTCTTPESLHISTNTQKKSHVTHD